MHTISLGQGLAISIVALLFGIDMWLEMLYVFRPIIISTVVGLILGDLKLGLACGGLTELVFAGLTPVGGTQPPNPVMAGVMVPVLAYLTGSTPQASVGLALPFTFLMQYIVLFYYSTFSLFMPKADRAAENADSKTIYVLAGTMTAIVAISFFIVAFLCSYLVQAPMKALVTSMPAWLINGFNLAGGILPGVGFAILLTLLFKIEYLSYFFVGFLFVCFIPFSNLLPVAIVGGILASFNYYNSLIKGNKTRVAAESEGEEDGI
jgi:PTS system galactosamine-specific IIC component